MNTQNQPFEAQTQTPQSTALTNAMINAAYLNLLNPELSKIQNAIYARLIGLGTQAKAQSGDTVAKAQDGAQNPTYNSTPAGITAAPNQLVDPNNQSPKMLLAGTSTANPNPTGSNLDLVFQQIESQSPNYFAQNPTRGELKNYLYANCSHLDSQELEKIIKLAQALEQAAIDGYKSQQNTAKQTEQKEPDFQKAIEEANRAAISKLATNTTNSKTTSSANGKIYTREQIAKMSPEEFKANKTEIFAQYIKGLIK